MKLYMPKNCNGVMERPVLIQWSLIAISGLHLYSFVAWNKGRCLDSLSLYKASAPALWAGLQPGFPQSYCQIYKIFLADIQESTARAVGWKVKGLCLVTLKHTNSTWRMALIHPAQAVPALSQGIQHCKAVSHSLVSASSVRSYLKHL